MFQNEISVFRIPTAMVYGYNSAALTGQKVLEYGATRVLIVTDRGVRGAGILAPVENSLKSSTVEYCIFDEIEENPSIETVNKVLDAYRQSGADAIVAVGGGSPIDTAKAVAILAANGGKIQDYEGVNKVAKPGCTLLAIPTTAGTGSELTSNVVITDHTRNYKFTIVSANSNASMAIIDPLMTASMPPKLTASTGIDAFTHALESYTSLMAYPVTETLALEAMSLISKNLRIAVADGSNMEARDKVLMGCVMATMAFNHTRLGNCHAMSHPLGGFFNVPHGVANAVLLPHVMCFNVPAAPGKFKRVAGVMGKMVQEMSELEAAWKAVEAVDRLCRDVGIPIALSDLGVKGEAILEMARDAMKSGNILVNPRKTTIEDIISLYQKAL